MGFGNAVRLAANPLRKGLGGPAAGGRLQFTPRPPKWFGPAEVSDESTTGRKEGRKGGEGKGRGGEGKGRGGKGEGRRQ